MSSFNRRKNKTPLRLPKFARANKTARLGAKPELNSLRRRGIYLLPNAFTTAALFCGFYAIVMAMNLKFQEAAIAIFAAMFLDGIDGRVARLTNTQSEFGAQYDSLSDMVSFGVAPALVIYEWSLRGLGKMGWLAAFVYCSGAALRLARFNTNIAVVDKRFFQGMPSPAAAALVAGLIWNMVEQGITGSWVPWLAWAVAVYAGVTMVTNIPFYSFKDVNFRKSVPFVMVFLIVLIFVAAAGDPPKFLFGVFVLYGISGYGVYLWRRLKGKPVSIIQTEEEVHVDDHEDHD